MEGGPRDVDGQGGRRSYDEGERSRERQPTARRDVPRDGKRDADRPRTTRPPNGRPPVDPHVATAGARRESAKPLSPAPRSSDPRSPNPRPPAGSEPARREVRPTADPHATGAANASPKPSGAVNASPRPSAASRPGMTPRPASARPPGARDPRSVESGRSNRPEEPRRSAPVGEPRGRTAPSNEAPAPKREVDAGESRASGRTLVRRRVPEEPRAVPVAAPAPPEEAAGRRPRRLATRETEAPPAEDGVGRRREMRRRVRARRSALPPEEDDAEPRSPEPRTSDLRSEEPRPPETRPPEPRSPEARAPERRAADPPVPRATPSSMPGARAVEATPSRRPTAPGGSVPEPRRDAADAWRAPPVEAPEDGDGAARRTLEAAPIRDETATPDREHHRSGRARPVIDAPDERTVVEGGPIVSPDTVSGRSMMAVIAIMTFLCSLLLGASLLIERAAGAWSSTVLEEVSVTVLPLDGEPIERRLQEVATLLEGAGGLADVEVVPEAQSEALLEPWLGSGVDLSVLPVPRLVVARRTGAIDTEFLTNAVASVPGASLDDHSAWSERLSGMASAVAFGAVAGLALIAVATAISVVFATRATIASNAATVEVLHLLGAEDRFVLRAFRRRFVVIGAKGALAGCVAALALFGLLDLWQLVSPGAHSPQAEALFGNPSIGPMGYIGLLAVAVGIIVLVAVTASLAVRHHLDRFIR